MDSALFNALKRQAELRDELSEIDRFIRLYNKFKSISSPQQSLKLEEPEPEQQEFGSEQIESNSAADNPAADAGTDDESFAPPRRGFTKEMLKPHLRAVILEAGRPLSRTQLLRALDRRKIPVGGSNRPKNMGTIMWRLGEDFVSLEGLGYWPKDKPYGPAGYVPKDLGNEAHSPEPVGTIYRATSD